MNTEIIFICDRSGSMHSIDRPACQGYNGFLDEQRGVPGEARVTNILFDDRYEVKNQALPLAQAPYMETLSPRGYTALYDAIGRTLDEQGRRIKAEGWAQKVICVVITDGAENRSRSYNLHRINEMITHAREHNWEFVFLAANISAEGVGRDLGFNPQYTYQFTANAAGTAQGYATASAATRSLRGTTF